MNQQKYQKFASIMPRTTKVYSLFDDVNKLCDTMVAEGCSPNEIERLQNLLYEEIEKTLIATLYDELEMNR